MNKESIFRILPDRFKTIPLDGDRLLFREKLPDADIDQIPEDEEIALLDPDRVPADFKPWAHTGDRLMDWREHANEQNRKLQTQEDDGEEMC